MEENTKSIERREEYTPNGIEAEKDISGNTEDIKDMEPKKKKRKVNPNSMANLRPWQPGQSGNPSGRKKTPNEVRDMLKDALEDAVKTLIELSQHAEKDSVRYQAAQDLVDRVLGKPTQPLDIDQTNAVKVEFVGGTDDLAK